MKAMVLERITGVEEKPLELEARSIPQKYHWGYLAATMPKPPRGSVVKIWAFVRPGTLFAIISPEMSHTVMLCSQKRNDS